MAHWSSRNMGWCTKKHSCQPSMEDCGRSSHTTRNSKLSSDWYQTPVQKHQGRVWPLHCQPLKKGKCHSLFRYGTERQGGMEINSSPTPCSHETGSGRKRRKVLQGTPTTQASSIHAHRYRPVDNHTGSYHAIQEKQRNRREKSGCAEW